MCALQGNTAREKLEKNPQCLKKYRFLLILYDVMIMSFSFTFFFCAYLLQWIFMFHLQVNLLIYSYTSWSKIHCGQWKCCYWFQWTLDQAHIYLRTLSPLTPRHEIKGWTWLIYVFEEYKSNIKRKHYYVCFHSCLPFKRKRSSCWFQQLWN